MTLRCEGCGHVWDGVPAGLSLGQVSGMIRDLRCPKCDRPPGQIFTSDAEPTEAKAEHDDSNETHHKHRSRKASADDSET